MSLFINTNVASLDAQRNLQINTNSVNTYLQQLSSGQRINTAADDAAGLQISQNFTAQINGVNQAVSNAQDGTNLLQTADGSLSVVEDNLQRIRELAVEAANGTNGSQQITAIAQEITARLQDITRIVNSTQFNGISLFQGTSSLRIQVGANSTQSNDTVNVASGLASVTATSLNFSNISTAGIASQLETNSLALTFLGTVDNALTTISTNRAAIGSNENRLQSAISNLQITSQNFSASNAQILDVDVASATSSLTQAQILQQAAASVLTQANQAPSIALKLIQGQ